MAHHDSTRERTARWCAVLCVAAFLGAGALAVEPSRASACSPAPTMSVAVAPSDGATGVPLNARVSVWFVQPVGDNLVVELRGPDGTIVPGDIAVELERSIWPVAHFVPRSELAPLTQYTVFATEEGARDDIAEIGMFTTGDTSDAASPSASASASADLLERPAAPGSSCGRRAHQFVVSISPAPAGDDGALAGYRLTGPGGLADVAPVEVGGGASLDVVLDCEVPSRRSAPGTYSIVAFDLAGNVGATTLVTVPDACSGGSGACSVSGRSTPSAAPLGLVLLGAAVVLGRSRRSAWLVAAVTALVLRRRWSVSRSA